MWVVIVAALLAGNDEASGPCPWKTRSERRATLAPKGIEMYSWRAPGGKTEFSILWGTNRNRPDREIRTPACVIDSVDEVKTVLGRLAPSQSVYWSTLCPDGGCSFPEKPVVEALKAHAHSVGISLDVLE
jgi:hypothetical protein